MGAQPGRSTDEPDPTGPVARVATLLSDEDPDRVADGLRRLLSVGVPPESLWSEIERLALEEEMTPQVRSLAIRAASRYCSRDAIRMLDGIARSDAAPDETKRNARDALSKMLGLPSASDDVTEEVAAVLLLSDQELSTRIATVQATRADIAEQRASRLESRLLQRLREITLLVPDAERDALLAPLLADESPFVRRFAAEQIRQIMGSREVGSVIEESAIAMLGSNSPAVRAEGAALVNLLAAEGAGQAVSAALQTELDPVAAEALLRAGVRWPASLTAEPITRWLKQSGRVRLAAAEAVWARHTAGLIGAGERILVLPLVRQIPDDELNPASARILLSFGDGVDRTRLNGLLVHESSATRAAVAGALALSRESVDTLVAAATRDRALVPIALDAAVRHLDDAGALRQALRLGKVSDEQIRPVFIDIAERLPNETIVSVASQTSAFNAEALLNLLMADARTPGADADEDAWIVYQQGLIELAEMRLRGGSAAAALAALERLGTPRPPIEARFRSTLLAGLLATASFERLNSLDPTAPELASSYVWLDPDTKPVAAAWLLTQPIANEFEDSFLDTLQADAPAEAPEEESDPIEEPPPDSDGG